MTRYALSAAILALIAIGGWGWVQSERADRATERALGAEQQAATYRAATEALDALLRDAEARAAARVDFDEWLGGRDDDAPVSDLIRDGLDRLRNGGLTSPAGTGANMPRP